MKVPAGSGRIFVFLLLPLSASCSRGSDYAIAHLRCATDALPIPFILVFCPVSFSCRCVTHSSPSPLPLFSLTRLQRICALRVVHRVSQFSCRSLQIARCTLQSRILRCRARCVVRRGARCNCAICALRFVRFMLCVVRCALRAARCALCIARCAVSQRAGCCALRVARCALRVARCALCVARCALRVACCALRVARCALCVARCALRVVRCALRVARCALRVARCNTLRVSFFCKRKKRR